MAQKTEATHETLFDKFAAVEEGDTFDVFGESLKAAHVDVHAASHSISAYGAHEDTDQPPRYDICVDAKHETVEFFQIRG